MNNDCGYNLSTIVETFEKKINKILFKENLFILIIN